MIIYGAIFIPIIMTVAAIIMWKRKFVWWEVVLPTLISLPLIILAKFAVDKISSTDIEYWGGWAITAAYVEDWDEEVPCRHPKYRTYTDSKGNVHTEFVGFEHAYDVDYHPPYWELADSNGEITDISQNEYAEIKGKFGNEKFIDLHRNYHSNDGDKYVTDAPNNLILPVVRAHYYENRVQASTSVYKPKKLTEAELKRTYAYPQATKSYYYPSMIGWAEGGSDLAEMNAILGAAKQIRGMILVYPNEPTSEVFFLQKDAWLNGNKNEFVTCIGINNDTVLWADCFCWENEQLKVEARNFLSEQIGKRLDAKAYVAWLKNKIVNENLWSRKHFRDFNYLSVDPPWWATMIVYILIIGINAALIYFLEENEYGM